MILALKRHEHFNGYTKTFACLSGRFHHHSVVQFASCFEAVCVICQYQMENGYPLFDILIEDMRGPKAKRLAWEEFQEGEEDDDDQS